MRFRLVLAFFATQLTLSLAGPVPDAAPVPNRANVDAAQAETCAILGTNVNCRYHANTNSEIIEVFSGGSVYFDCNSVGECINGNCYWDYTPTYDCFVSARYTGANCNPDNLPLCGFDK